MKVRPLHDRILIKRIEEKETVKGGIIIPDTAKEKPQEGEVIAAGNGKKTDDGKLIPLDVKAGDRILFGKGLVDCRPPGGPQPLSRHSHHLPGARHRRAESALDRLWPYTAELFVPDEVDRGAESLRAPWLAQVEPLLGEATLAIPADTKFLSTGRRGVHSEHLGYVLAEMQFLQRAYPGARW